MSKSRQLPTRNNVNGSNLIAITNQQGNVCRVVECDADLAVFCDTYNASMRGNSHAIPFAQVKPEQWLRPEPNCYFSLVVFIRDKFRPTSFVQLPHDDALQYDGHWDFSAAESLVQSRDEAFAAAAESNRESLNNADSEAWYFVARMVPADEEWGTPYMLDGMRGCLDGAYIPFEVVEPTAEELQRYAIPAKTRRGGKVGAV